MSSAEAAVNSERNSDYKLRVILNQEMLACWPLSTCLLRSNSKVDALAVKCLVRAHLQQCCCGRVDDTVQPVTRMIYIFEASTLLLYYFLFSKH